MMKTTTVTSVSFSCFDSIGVGDLLVERRISGTQLRLDRVAVPRHPQLAGVGALDEIAEAEHQVLRRVGLGPPVIPGPHPRVLATRLQVERDLGVGGRTVQLQNHGLGATPRIGREVESVRVLLVALEIVRDRAVEPRLGEVDQPGPPDLHGAAPVALTARVGVLHQHLGRGEELDLDPDPGIEFAFQVPFGVDHLAVLHHVDGLDRLGAHDAAGDRALFRIGRAPPHGCAVQRDVDDDPLSGRGVAGARAHSVEQGVGGVLRRDHRGQASQLAVLARRVAGLGGVVVRGADEADLEAVRQVPVAVPLEGPVPGLDLGKTLHDSVVLSPVAGTVDVGDDEHVLGVVDLA
jgi:hypothetical protein